MEHLIRLLNTEMSIVDEVILFPSATNDTYQE